MFSLFKKQVTAKEYGHQMWLLCCDFAEQFCLHFRPELQESGYLKNNIEDRKFMDEAMHLHLWIIFCALGKENSGVLDVVNNYAMTFIAEQQSKKVSIRERCELYQQAYIKDMEEMQHNKGAWPIELGKAALQCLVNYKSASPSFIETNVETVILGAIKQVRDLREKNKIKV